MKSYKQLYTEVEQEISALPLNGNPQNLYEPVRYIMSLGGKRLRPVLCLMANDLFGGEVQKAIPAALAVEVFHNFTLVHDDIMDNASLRRGKPTVHEKWNETIAILSGDLMMVKAIDLLALTAVEDIRKLLFVFNKAAREVCEGQQIDMNFETQDIVSSEEYIDMITLKTAVLLGASLQLGALIGGANDANAEKIYAFGKHIGIAFQIQDDILDSFGEGEKTGKKVGGDIASNKKTLLWIEALHLANTLQKQQLEDCLKLTDEAEKISRVLVLYRELNVLQQCEQKKKEHLDKAFACLNEISVSEDRKRILKESAEDLMSRMS